MKNKEAIWIDIHQICGDCGKRIKEKIDLEKQTLGEVIEIITSYYLKYNMACAKCSNKNQ